MGTQTLVAEKAELDARIKVLNDFVATSDATTVTHDEAPLLDKQLYAMREYSEVLRQRIELALTH